MLVSIPLAYETRDERSWLFLLKEPWEEQTGHELFMWLIRLLFSDQLTLDGKKYNKKSINTQRLFLSFFLFFGNGVEEHAKGRVVT